MCAFEFLFLNETHLNFYWHGYFDSSSSFLHPSEQNTRWQRIRIVMNNVATPCTMPLTPLPLVSFIVGLKRVRQIDKMSSGHGLYESTCKPNLIESEYNEEISSLTCISECVWSKKLPGLGSGPSSTTMTHESPFSLFFLPPRNFFSRALPYEFARTKGVWSLELAMQKLRPAGDPCVTEESVLHQQLEKKSTDIFLMVCRIGILQ